MDMKRRIFVAIVGAILGWSGFVISAPADADHCSSDGATGGVHIRDDVPCVDLVGADPDPEPTSPPAPEPPNCVIQPYRCPPFTPTPKIPSIPGYGR
jgi:hypothetical protein